MEPFAFTRSLHNHCTLCDGTSTAREMLDAAVAAGIRTFGMSSHGPDPIMPDYCIESEASYIKEIRALADEYASQIEVLCGLEQESRFPVANRAAFDYLIGSVHYLAAPNNVVTPVDLGHDSLAKTIAENFSGDALACVRSYYEEVVRQARLLDVRKDIVGHFDLICLCNKPQPHDQHQDELYCEESNAYRHIALEALDAVAETGITFEVNTAGYRKGLNRPYPAPFLLRRLRELHKRDESLGRIIITTDAHCTKDITAGVQEAAALLACV